MIYKKLKIIALIIITAIIMHFGMHLIVDLEPKVEWDYGHDFIALAGYSVLIIAALLVIFSDKNSGIYDN